MAKGLRLLLGILVVLALVGGPVVFALHLQAEMRNFRVVREGVLYRSGQMSVAGLRRLVHDRGIRTVVSLRDALKPGELPPDRDEEEFCLKEGIVHIRIPPRHWEGPDGSAPADEGVRTFLKVMRDPDNYPVLIHCFAGVHRTGAYCAVYRIEFEGWSNTQAIAEVKGCGYANLDDEWDILGYLEHYRPGRLDEERPGPNRRGPKPRRKAVHRSE
jgi:protein tyrosine/serine phosphatase